MPMQQKLMLELADHLEGIVQTIRRHHGSADDPPPSQTEPDGGLKRAPKEVLAHAREAHPLLGSHQEMVIKALAEADPNSLTVSQINTYSRTQPNTHMTLDKLELLGLVKASAGRPKRYVLGAAFD
jgi:predicted transcriptional regulator